jgi:dTDP-4-amino-4,6-dideoxygalactose transaminase
MSHDAWRRYSDAGFKHYQVVECGFKYNMMDLQAALGIHQLGRVERWWERRREIVLRYREQLADLPLRFQSDAPEGSRHTYHLFPIVIDNARAKVDRDTFLEAMTARKFQVGVHYQHTGASLLSKTFQWRPQDYQTPYLRTMRRRLAFHCRD